MLRGLTVAAVAVLAATIAGAAGAGSSALPGTNGRVIVQDGNGLWVVNPTSGARLPLTAVMRTRVAGRSARGWTNRNRCPP